MFQFPESRLSEAIFSLQDTRSLLRVGSPIRISTALRMLTAYRRISLFAASFFASLCLGIRHTLFLLDLLVSVRLTCRHAYTPDLSTLSSLRGLTHLRFGKSHLEVGFTLRCLQRLSLPYLATQLCHWRDNWCTIDMSIPVLSY